MKDGFLRVAAVTPDIKVADCDHNADEIIKYAKEAARNDASVIVFPELCITGSTCGDLFLQKTLLDGAKKAVKRVADETADCNALIIVGFPFEIYNKLYNCAAVITNGKVVGIVPKKVVLNYGEFCEARYFAEWNGGFDDVYSELTAPFFTVYIGDRLFKCTDFHELVVGVEIGDNGNASELAAEGATVICNLSASPEIVGRSSAVKKLAEVKSAELHCGYIRANAGMGESTRDLVFSGYNLVAENGKVIAESKKFTTGITYTEIDLFRIAAERRKVNTFAVDTRKRNFEMKYDTFPFSLNLKYLNLQRHFPLNPFVPEVKDELRNRCEEILTMQATGLATRLRHINCKTAVVGLSGGLDSTLALIVTVHAFDMLGLDRKGIVTVTMPCFGTTSRTKNNAYYLAEAYGVTLKEINIAAAVRQHFADIGQDESNLDVTYENSQARERTQVLMDIANMMNGLVIGTGDLSELALGWATYNGDHMSMYGVNGSVPKTLVRHLVAFESNNTEDTKLSEVLRDILDTPVSPELLPPKEGEISQKTEDIVGPYELHDFFLYYLVRCGFAPSKIFRIAEKTFDGIYDSATIKKWLTIFVRRFFTQQFKRSCLPDGPKVGTVSLSPRGDWNMPSDACVRLWLEDLEK
ncbi:MAG: NAD(+) synthase [Oscillospiraceae bacterium]|nr:NAD(+) synthase [Oscillospiraceae bacterium]